MPGDEEKKASGSSGWGGFGNIGQIGASLKEMGESMEEKMRAQQQQYREGEGKSGGSSSQLSGKSLAGSGLMSRFGKSNHGDKKKEESVSEQGESQGVEAGKPSSTGGSLANRSPDNVSKEELLEILKKMNTRVKALSQSRVQLSDKVKSVENEKARLLNLLKTEILDEMVLADAAEKVRTAMEKDPSAKTGDMRLDEVMVRFFSLSLPVASRISSMSPTLLARSCKMHGEPLMSAIRCSLHTSKTSIKSWHFKSRLKLIRPGKRQ